MYEALNCVLTIVENHFLHSDAKRRIETPIPVKGFSLLFPTLVMEIHRSISFESNCRLALTLMCGTYKLESIIRKWQGESGQ